MSAASKEATAVLIANGTVYTVGGNSHGELGTGISKSVEYNTQLEKVTTIRKEDEASENQEELNNVTRIVGKGITSLQFQRSTITQVTQILTELRNMYMTETEEFIHGVTHHLHNLVQEALCHMQIQALILVLSWVKRRHIIQMYR